MTRRAALKTWLAFLFAALMACNVSLIPAGQFTVAFKWKGGAPPASLTYPLFVSARIVDAAHHDRTVAVGESKTYTFGTPTSLGFLGDFYDRSCVVIIEMRRTSDAQSQLIAYGESQPFTVKVSENKRVDVELDLQTVPGDGLVSGAIGLKVLPTDEGGTEGYVRQSLVTLSLTPGTGVKVKLANHADDVAKATPRPLAVGADGTAQVVAWDLENDGLTPTGSGGCDLTMVQTGCPRRVYAQFIDANERSSAIVSAEVVLDTLKPAVSASAIVPAAAKLNDSISITISANEPLRGAAVPTVTPVESSSVIELSGGPEVFTYGVLDTRHDGQFDVTFALTDLAGNRQDASPTVPLRLTIDTVVPVITNLETMNGFVSPAAEAVRFSEASGFNNLLVEFDLAKSLECPSEQCVVSVDGQMVTSCTTSPSTTAARHYSCPFGVPAPPAETSGSKPITVSTHDAAGNTDFASRSVVFDFEPPVVSGQLRPLSARLGDRPTLTVTSDKPVLRPTVSVAPSSILDHPMSTDGQASTSWLFQFPAVDPSLHDTFTVGVQATDDVGHTVRWGDQFEANGIVPAITRVTGQNGVYSEVPGFNVVTTTFNVAKDLDGVSGGLRATVGRHSMQCDPYSATAPNYTCRWPIPQVPAPEDAGPEVIFIQTADAVGNTDSVSMTVTFDFTPLDLALNVSTPKARIGDEPIVTVSSNKNLSGPPDFSAPGPGGTLTLPRATPQTAGQNWSWKFEAIAAGSPAGPFDLTATATDATGHGRTIHSGLDIDSATPVITNVRLDPGAHYSAQTGHNFVTLRFDTTAVVDPAIPATGTVSASIASVLTPMICDQDAPGVGSYHCTYPIDGSEANDGTEVTDPVLIEVRSPNGNVGTGSTSLAFDFKAPSVAFATVNYAPDDQNPITKGTVATYGTTITVLVTASEPIDPTKEVVLDARDTLGNVLRFSLVGSARSDGATFEAVVPPLWPGVAPTVLIPSVGWTDLVGNKTSSASFEAPEIVLQTAATASNGGVLAAPRTEVTNDEGGPGPIVYNRVPWGSAGGAAEFSLTAGNGAARGATALVVYDSPDRSSANQLGIAPVDPETGAVVGETIPLRRADHQIVYVASADEAGNLSPIVATHNVSWTASLRGKVAGSTIANPNAVLANAAGQLFPPGSPTPMVATELPGVLNPSAEPASEISDYAPFRGPGAGVLTTAQVRDWAAPPAPPTSTPPWGPMVYDSARGVVVLVDAASETWEWDGTNWSQKFSLTRPPPGRSYFCLTYDARRGITVLFGGLNVQGWGIQTFTDTWEWNGVSWTQRSPKASPPFVYGNGASYYTLHGPQMVYDAARSVSVLYLGSETWEWDGDNWTHSAPRGPELRFGDAKAYDSDRGVTVSFGGSTGYVHFADTWEWNGALWRQRFPVRTPPARWNHGMAYDPGRKITVLFGGTIASEVSGFGDSPNLTDTWEWNGNDWNQRTSLHSPPAMDTSLVYDRAHGMVVAFGGGTQLWGWDGADWKQLSVSPGTAPSARLWSGIAYDAAHGNTVLFGGQAASSSPACPRTGVNEINYRNHDVPCNDTWLWDGRSWLQADLSAAVSPGTRSSPAMAYDSGRGVTVLFGGGNEYDQQYYNDTWEWNGSSWRDATPADGTGPAGISRMIYDAARGVSVLVGGVSGVEVWEWNGLIWSPRTPDAGPWPRSGFGLAYDASRGVTVLFGGVAGSEGPGCPAVTVATFVSGTYYFCGDTWEWDGVAWTQRFPVTSPPARQYPGLVYDSTRGVTLLVGGQTPTQPGFCYASSFGYVCGDVWEWDGSNWTQDLTAASLPPRYGHAMVFDPVQSVTTLFGGLAPPYLADTWLLDDKPSARPVNVARFDFGATGETRTSASLNGLTVSASGGATGHDTSGAVVPGVALAAWDIGAGGAWRVLATNNASAESPAPLGFSTSSPLETSALLFSDTSFNFALFPTQQPDQGRTSSQLGVGDVELNVSYTHFASGCTVTVGSQCVCAADETECGTGTHLCSDTSSDPWNCGGCTESGGAVCGAGIACINGVCGCPGAEVACSGVCADLTHDALNCGSCGWACGPSASCVEGVCLPCEAGQASVGGACVSDLAIRSATNQTSDGDQVSLSIGSVSPGDLLVTIVAPKGPGFCATTVSSPSGAWSLAGRGADSGQALVAYTKVATEHDSRSFVAVAMTGCTGLNATLIDVYSQTGATVSVDESAFGGSIRQTGAPAGLASGLAPELLTSGPNELVLVAAAQPGTTPATVPEGVAVLTQNGGFVTGSYTSRQPRAVPAQQFTGDPDATWGLAQIALASSATGAGDAVPCPGTQVRWEGICVEACRENQTRCGALCVDLSSDRTNCGVCGNTCGSTLSCSSGSCQPNCSAIAVCRNQCTTPACEAQCPAIGYPQAVTDYAALMSCLGPPCYASGICDKSSPTYVASDCGNCRFGLEFNGGACETVFTTCASD